MSRIYYKSARISCAFVTRLAILLKGFLRSVISLHGGGGGKRSWCSKARPGRPANRWSGWRGLPARRIGTQPGQIGINRSAASLSHQWWPRAAIQNPLLSLLLSIWNYYIQADKRLCTAGAMAGFTVRPLSFYPGRIPPPSRQNQRAR